MSVRKYLIAGLVAVCGLSADRASAQVSVGPAGVTIGGSSGRGVVVPYSGVRNTTIIGQNGAYTPATGTTYSPAYQTPYGGTSYYSPQTGNFYNPNYGTYSAPTAPVYNTVPGTVYSTPGTVYSPTPVYQTPGVYGSGYAAPVYSTYPGTVVSPSVPVGGFRVR